MTTPTPEVAALVERLRADADLRDMMERGPTVGGKVSREAAATIESLARDLAEADRAIIANWLHLFTHVVAEHEGSSPRDVTIRSCQFCRREHEDLLDKIGNHKPDCVVLAARARQEARRAKP